MKKQRQKDTITNVIAPEFDKHYHDALNKLKRREKEIIEQIQNHSNSFRNKMDGAAKGDWVDSAKNEIEKIDKKLDDII